MNQRTIRFFVLLTATFVLLVTTATVAFGAGSVRQQQAAPSGDGPLTQETLEQFWQEMYPGVGPFGITAAEENVYTYTRLAKAAPDECYNGLFDTVPLTMTLPDCEGGRPKVNEAYVWGVTDYSNTIWFGTAPNVHCLVMGGYLGATSPVETDSYACQFGAGPYVPPLPDIIGDWRPPKLYVYDNDSATLTDISPDGTTGFAFDPRFVSNTLGIRSAGTFGNYVFFGGPAFTPTASINIFMYDAATQTYLGAKNLPTYSNIRKWLEVDGKLYVAVGKGTDGAVLRYTGDPTDLATRFDFVEVGVLDADGAEIALHDGRLFVNTWPGSLGTDVAGLWMSPVISPAGLTSADVRAWRKVFSYDEYEPDTVTAHTYGGGALLSYDGDLYWGTMHVPFVATLANLQVYEADYVSASVPVQVAALNAMLGTQRAVSIFRGRDFGTPDQEVEVLYGMEQLPAFDAATLTWNLTDTLLGPPLYGTAGFGNLFNNYTWSMAAYDGQLFVGTMDWSYLLTDIFNSLLNELELPLDLEINLPEAIAGADLYRFYAGDQPALPENLAGVGNYTSYGIRNMLGRDDGVYLGMANPMNLLTDPTDDKPEGGWELIRLTRHLIPLTVDLGGNGSGSVVSSLAGIDCGASCTASYDHGFTVVLTPTADVGSTFTGWTGVCFGLSTCTVQLNAATTVTANFTLDIHNFSVGLDGDGSGSVISDPEGINCGTACDEDYNYGTTITLTATADAGSLFAGWSGACSGTGACAVTITDTAHVTATFANNRFPLTVTLTGDGSGNVTSDPTGINCSPLCDAQYDGSTTVTLTPTATSGSIFTGWSGACSGTDTCEVTITGTTLVTATFANNRFPLAVALTGDGSGSITSDPAGITCSPVCDADYDGGTTVTLTPTAASGSIFTGWSGACSGTDACEVTITGETQITATFANNRFPLTVTLAGDGSGNVTSDPAGINCSPLCDAQYDGSTPVTLVPTADAGSIFTGWSGACSGTDTCEVTITGTTQVTATFANNRFPLEVHLTGDGGGYVASLPAGIACSQPSCSAHFDNGTHVALSAIAFSGSSFDAWSGACSGSGECEVVIGPATTVVTATFSPNPQNANLKVSGEPFIGSRLDFTATLNLNPIQECTWDFGDGSSEACDLPVGAANADATHDVTIHASHVYTRAGVFIVIVTASNEAGSVIAAQQITIQTPTAEPPTQQPDSTQLYFPYLHRADE